MNTESFTDVGRAIGMLDLEEPKDTLTLEVRSLFEYLGIHAVNGWI